ncbi:hypothetical protein D3C75_1009660 [compost metagenome]
MKERDILRRSDAHKLKNVVMLGNVLSVKMLTCNEQNNKSCYDACCDKRYFVLTHQAKRRPVK